MFLNNDFYSGHNGYFCKGLVESDKEQEDEVWMDHTWIDIDVQRL